jgi:heptaprenyl diphosphate synthase
MTNPQAPMPAADNTTQADVRRLAALVAGASVLQVAESLLPHPLPGVRLGLANVMTLVALVELGAGPAIGLTVVRTLVSAMLLGTFLSPAFWMSFAGGITSTSVMVGLYLWSRRFPVVGFGLLGISVAGAATHMMAQVALVYLVFIRSPGVLLLWPWLGLGAVATGVLTGLVAAQAVDEVGSRGRGIKDSSEDEARSGEPGRRVQNDETRARAWAQSIAAEWKLVVVFALSLAVVLWGNYWFYLAVFGLLLAASLAAGLGLRPLGRNVGRLWPLALAALAMPLVFTGTGRVLFVLGPWRLTLDGVVQGTVFCCRLVLLYFATSLLAETTPAAKLARGLGRMLAPLHSVGVRPELLAELLLRSWESFGRLWTEAGRLVREGSAGERKRGVGGWVRLPGVVVARLYLAALEEGR